MAPPLTLTLSVSQPRSLLTAIACAANASLASTRSRSSAFQPAFSSALREAGIGPDAHDRRIDADLRPGDDPRQRRRGPRRWASSADISTTAAAPSLMPEALPAVTVPSLLKAGRSLAMPSTVAPKRGILVRVDHDVALAGL